MITTFGVMSMVQPNIDKSTVRHPTGYFRHWNSRSLTQSINLRLHREPLGAFLNMTDGTCAWTRYTPRKTTPVHESNIGFTQDAPLFQTVFFSTCEVMTCEGITLRQCVDNVAMSGKFLQPYRVFTMIVSFLLPLGVTIASYSVISYQISKMIRKDVGQWHIIALSLNVFWYRYDISNLGIPNHILLYILHFYIYISVLLWIQGAQE